MSHEPPKQQNLGRTSSKILLKIAKTPATLFYRTNKFLLKRAFRNHPFVTAYHRLQQLYAKPAKPHIIRPVKYYSRLKWLGVKIGALYIGYKILLANSHMLFQARPHQPAPVSKIDEKTIEHIVML